MHAHREVPESSEAAIFVSLAKHAERIMAKEEGILFQARPLGDDDLERIVLSRNDPRPANRFVFTAKKAAAEKKCLSPSVKKKRPLFGCAFAGAVSVTALVKDAATVMHCPRSCALMIAEKLLATEYYGELRYGTSSSSGLNRTARNNGYDRRGFYLRGREETCKGH